MAKGEHRAGSVVAVIGALYGLHSLLASDGAKALARRLLGGRYSPGLYRFGYSVQSVLCFVGGALWFLRQPDREIYRLRGPWALAARAMQLGGALMLLDMARVVGPLRLLGVSQTFALLRGQVPPPTPVAQGPPLGADGEIDARGSFRHIRHPDNLPAVLVLFGFPRMTWNRLALAVVSTVYAVAGSLHEDVRLRRAYGAAFERYRRATPLLLPRPGRRRRTALGAAADGPR
jgi:hypothetical protein